MEYRMPEQWETDEVAFLSSDKSRVGRLERGVKVGALLGVLLPLVLLRVHPALLVTTMVMCLLAMVPLWWVLRRRLKPGTPLLRVGREFIESPVFAGGELRIPWSEVETVASRVQYHVPVLELRLRPHPGRPDRRNWRGVNPARPWLALDVFDQATQQDILAEVRMRLDEHAAQSGRTVGVSDDEVEEVRRFEERLKALAPVPWVTYGLVAANVAIWLLTLGMGAGVDAAQADRLLQWGGNAASEVQRGEWWRLASAMFLHSGIAHVAMNMIGLLAAGPTVERIYGHRLFVLVYLGAGLLGSALSLHFSAQAAVSVGASGAVFGVLGALLVAVLQHRHDLPAAFGKQMLGGMTFFTLYSLVQGFGTAGIDNAAHVGGLFGGCLLATVLPERFDLARFAERVRRRAAAAVVLVLAIAGGLAVIAPEARVDQKARFLAVEVTQQAMEEFSRVFMLIQQDHDARESGNLSDREMDLRGRNVYAPALREVLVRLDEGWMPGEGPVHELLAAVRQVAELAIEALEMETVFALETGKLEPIDPQRMARIDEEITAAAERMSRYSEALVKANGR